MIRKLGALDFAYPWESMFLSSALWYYKYCTSQKTVDTWLIFWGNYLISLSHLVKSTFKPFQFSLGSCTEGFCAVKKNAVFVTPTQSTEDAPCLLPFLKKHPLALGTNRKAYTKTLLWLFTETWFWKAWSKTQRLCPLCYHGDDLWCQNDDGTGTWGPEWAIGTSTSTTGIKTDIPPGSVSLWWQVVWTTPTFLGSRISREPGLIYRIYNWEPVYNDLRVLKKEWKEKRKCYMQKYNIFHIVFTSSTAKENERKKMIYMNVSTFYWL